MQAKAIGAVAAGFMFVAHSALAQGDLRGHGGPVRALSVAQDGLRAVSGSFDGSAIIWILATGGARAVLRAHEGSVNAVLATPERTVTAGEDGRIAIWPADGAATPLRAFKAHDAPIAALSLSPDGEMIASAGWDGIVKLHRLHDGKREATFAGHQGNVNAVAFSPDGRSLVSGGYDGALRIWPLSGGAARVINLAFPVSSVVIPGGRTIAAGLADGDVVFLDFAGSESGRLKATETPVTAMAASPDGLLIAAASPRGAVAVIDVATRRLRFTLNGPGLPVWSLAFTPDGKHILTGGSDRTVRRWDARSGEHVGGISDAGADDDLAAFRHLPGAEVFKACSVCHTLRPDSAGRAGPTLYGLFGRKAGSLPGYEYSPAFRNLDLVWTPETVARLFEIGPQAYTPGTKMPEQTVGNAEERKALIDFLRAATAPK